MYIIISNWAGRILRVKIVNPDTIQHTTIERGWECDTLEQLACAAVDQNPGSYFGTLKSAVEDFKAKIL